MPVTVTWKPAEADSGLQTYPTLLGILHAGAPVAGAVGALLGAQEMGLGRLQHTQGLELEGVGWLLALVAAAQPQALKHTARVSGCCGMAWHTWSKQYY